MKLWIGLKWDINKDIFEEDMDIDLLAFQLNQMEKVDSERDFIFYNNPISQTESIKFYGDNKIGSTNDNLDNETIEINTDNIPENINKVVVTTSIYEAKGRKQNFAMVLNASIRVFDSTNQIEIIRYDLSEDFPYEKTIIVGELIRENEGQFKFHPRGIPFDGELSDLCEVYGLSVED